MTERNRKPTRSVDLIIGSLLTILVAAAIWLIMIPEITKDDGKIGRALPTCRDIAKQKPESDRLRFIQECESRQSATYVTSIMSAM